MSRPFLSTALSKSLWQYLAVLAVVVAPIALFAAFWERSDLSGDLITTPHPLATTTPTGPNPYAGIDIAGRAAIVYDLSTGQALFSQDADRQLPLASLTKLLSAYAGARAFSPATPITISSTSLAAEGESGLFESETFAFSDLARYSLVGSSNDAAEAITEAVSQRSGVQPAAMLAGAAASAGLTKTRATNGTGLDVDLATSGGYGSARDVAILAGELIKAAPDVAKATTHPSVTVRSASGIVHTLPNTNQGAIRVPGILLSKTGFTDLAGGNLVVVFDAGIDHPVAVVVLGSTVEGRFSDVNRLIDATHQYFAGLPAR